MKSIWNQYSILYFSIFPIFAIITFLFIWKKIRDEGFNSGETLLYIVFAPIYVIKDLLEKYRAQKKLIYLILTILYISVILTLTILSFLNKIH